MKYARECSVTGEGMNAGWVFGDGVFYAKYEKDALAECRRDRDAILQDIEDVDISMIQDQFCEEDAGWKLFNDAVQRALQGKEPDEDLMTLAFQTDYAYYTEWDDEDAFQFETNAH